ncbi:hypothetical protein JCGZ_16285 [Jatropha curcas]|uniref:PUM-HD domain-containing protein n=1 Tax=Jatropha curcas TaxID=180498 RepID=A0A067L7Q5_JATCU|nr:pumilio homolog 12 [Jatropha curcas]KDP44452.1 hypothetical protein JCGZ_16285 [Jatropha curcas]
MDRRKHDDLQWSSFTVENPSFTVENPSLVVENPSLMAENPSLMVENPSFMVENPSLMVENPSLMVENASLMVENPSLLVENPFLSPYLSQTLNHHHLNNLGLAPAPEQNNHHHPQNPISSPQNPNIQNLVRFYQNPRNSQNHLLLRENLHHQHQHHLTYPMAIGTSLESGLHLNPNPSLAETLDLENQYHETLETALSRMNISATHSYPSPHHHHSNSLINRGFSNQQQPLNRMRSISANLGLLRAANSTSLTDRHRALLNQSFSNNNRINLQRRSPSYDGFNYDYSTRSNVFRPSSDSVSGFDSQFRRARSVNGLEETNSSPLLSALYNRQSKNQYTLDLVKGRVVMVARDQEGCRFLQKKIEEQKAEQIEMIFLEVKDHLCDLIVDQFANYLIQKLFGICNEEQMGQLLLSLIRNEQKLLDICIHLYGTRAVQKMIEHIRTPEQTSTLISSLKNITVSLSKHQNGHHVIQQCIKCFRVDDTKCLLEEIAKSCFDIAMDKSGCCVLQKSVNQAQGEVKERLVAEITNNALVLSEHPYGNYVVQFVLDMNIPRAEANVLERLRGNFVTLSMNKYGSNVVEKCLKECNEKNASAIIEELMHSPDFLDVLQDPFGNYVVQSALIVSKGDLHHALVSLINIYYPYLHSHLHGKKVLARTRGNRNRI